MNYECPFIITASNTLDSELSSYFADCKTYVLSNGLHFWFINKRDEVPSFSSPATGSASQAYMERMFSVCGVEN